MVNEEKYFDELQNIISETKSMHGFNDHWNEVLERLDQLSIEYAKEIATKKIKNYIYMAVPTLSAVGSS